MASLFNTLGVGYSGLAAAQVAINTTGHNISNAENEGYTRQRVVMTASTALTTVRGNIGNGVDIQDIKRVFDNFVFDRFTGISADKEFSDFEKQTLEELSTYFPEIDGVGLKADLSEYYNMWQTFGDNPDNDAIKVALAKQTQKLAQHITQIQDQVTSMQSQLNDQLAVNVKQVNELAQQLAEINLSIDTAESTVGFSANDLRDKRNVIEKDMARLIGAESSYGQITANISIDSNSNTRSGSYTLSVNGFNIVDGSTFHPIYISNKTNAAGYNELSYERQDGTLISMEEEISNGKIGAILSLRGSAIDTTSGEFVNGTIQNVRTQLNAFASGLIEGTNNLYAASAKSQMQSNVLNIDPNASLISSNLNVKKGDFDVVVYDIDGNEVARRTININDATSIAGASNSIKSQMTASLDDNADGNANNNIDDIVTGFNYQPAADGTSRLEFAIDPIYDSRGYKFSIEDKLSNGTYVSGTNFAGALGLGRFLDGDNAHNINLTSELRDNATLISAAYSSSSGDNRVALDMVQQQFESYKFKVGNQNYDATVYGMFDVTSTYVGISTNSAILRNETISTQFNATQMEYNSTSKVSIDEELTNLIRYQTAYGAAAKIITTVDQMMQTLLGIKQ